MDNKKVYLVTNRSAGRVFYSVPELGIKSREYQPGETKRVTFEELEGLSYLPGGAELIRNYLLIRDEEARNDLVGKVEPEYNMTDKEVQDLIKTGSMDEWLDCLDFAPEGVIDLIKSYSVDLPLTDTRKIDAFKEKKGVDLGKMIEIKQQEIAAEKAAQQQSQQADRRVAPAKAAPVSETPTARRTSGSKYTVATKKTEE